MPLSAEVHGLAYPLDTPMPIPELTRFLREYPRSGLPGAAEFFYWNMGEFGMKPTTRLNQVVIQPFPAGVASLPGLRYVIATRQIYANHYFSATLELRTLVDDDDGEDDGFFLLYATRSRVSACRVSSRACCARSSRGAHDRGWDGTWRIRKPSSRVVPPAITEPYRGREKRRQLIARPVQTMTATPRDTRPASDCPITPYTSPVCANRNQRRILWPRLKVG